MRSWVDPNGTSFNVSTSPPSSGIGLGGGSTARPVVTSLMYPHPPKSDLFAGTEIVTGAFPGTNGSDGTRTTDAFASSFPFLSKEST